MRLLGTCIQWENLPIEFTLYGDVVARAEVTTNDNEILKDESHLRRMNGVEDPL